MIEEEDLRYGEVIKARRKTTILKYNEKIHFILRNIILKEEDLDKEGILTNDFFNRTDINEQKLELLQQATAVVSCELEELVF